MSRWSFPLLKPFELGLHGFKYSARAVSAPATKFPMLSYLGHLTCTITYFEFSATSPMSNFMDLATFPKLEQFALSSPLEIFDVVPAGHPLKRITAYGNMDETGPSREPREYNVSRNLVSLQLTPAKPVTAFSKPHYFGPDIELNWFERKGRPV